MSELSKFEIALKKLADLEDFLGGFPYGTCPEYIEAVNAIMNWSDLQTLFMEEYYPGTEKEEDAVLAKLIFLFETLPDNVDEDLLYDIKSEAQYAELKNYITNKLEEMGLPPEQEDEFDDLDDIDIETLF